MSVETTERRHEIVQIARSEGRVLVSDLAQRFAVSDVTIRTDLNLLGKRGMLMRMRGGALASNRILKELSLEEKATEQADIKYRLSVRARDYICDGDSLILDSGSTTAALARHLTGFQRLMVMTNGLNVAQNLATIEGVDVMMTGGTLRKKSQSFFGPHAEESLARFNFDKLILGVDGLDFAVGITTHFEYEAILNRRMCAAAKQIIVVTDSSKFNRAGLHKILGFGEFDVLITDSGIPDKFVGALEAQGVELSIVDAFE
jgi:DeoR family transcriptional regulator, aga operon transcriptional repressor